MSGVFHGMRISASGLQAERMRLEVSAGNIARSGVTRTSDGRPYRRQVISFTSLLQGAQETGGVRVDAISSDPSPFPRVFRPGHPDADSRGMLELSNVSVPLEMVELGAAARAYEANLVALRTFKELGQRALSIGTRG
ncbi:MAG: flagellar basal body rod protein FlgC [Planctomycetes bacterium]|nr:flagellar basal body rod protein FlgC [Planctomycetota bacterium]